jgi:hypothetical protein
MLRVRCTEISDQKGSSMSDVVALASVRQHQHASTQESDERANDVVVPPNETSLTARPNVISAALSARRSIAVSALALARGAQASVLHLLR